LLVECVNSVYNKLMLVFSRRLFAAAFLALISLGLFGTQLASAASTPAINPQSGSIGVQGTIQSPPPKTGATISVPTNGQTFTALPITVRGLCPADLLVEVFKNNVFGGSTQCKNGSYEVTIDLFSGRNDLVARVYDALNQAGPDSNIVTVNFNDADFATFGPHVALTSEFARRGANPGETLDWPIILSGGVGPYAISVDWGDGTKNDLSSLESPGLFNIKHKYESSGSYKILVKVTDKNDGTAYLQLVGVSNGKPSQSTSGTSNNKTVFIVRVVWWPAAVAIPLIIITFWLGRRHELYVLRKQLEKREAGSKK
jgi:hypothetical protein